MSTWSVEDIDALERKIAVVTGGNCGIGMETAKELARAGAFVIIASDNLEKGQKALDEISSQCPKSKIIFESLDLGSAASIAKFCDRLMQEYSHVDMLINNAGLAGIPQRMETVDGHELIFGVNYLGHFSLTAQLFPLVMRGLDPRIIFVSSIDHKKANIHFEDLEYHAEYNATKVYGQSKLALLMFALELHRRCLANGIKVKSIPVHPGTSLEPLYQRLLLKSLGQRAQTGALPLLFAATSLEARSGIYYGPDGPFEWWGRPTEAKVALQAENLLARERLWIESEKLSGVRFDISHTKTIGLH